MFVARLRLGILLAVASAAALFTWVLLRDEGGNERSSHGASAKPEAVSPAYLRGLTGEVGHPVYWAGARQGQIHELTRASDGSVYIRYLPARTHVGDKRPSFLTVGTYPHPQAFATVRRAARRDGEYVRRLANGGLAVSRPDRPSSVYFAYPGSNLLVETYAPSPARARALVLSGQVRPIR
jgi:hypothetical protein